MSAWHHWLESWLAEIEIPLPEDVPDDQFVVSTETGVQYVLENCIDHLTFSMRFPAASYREEVLAKHLLQVADPQQSRPFCIRLGHDGVKYLIVCLQLDFNQHRTHDLEAGFKQLWSIGEDLAALSV